MSKLIHKAEEATTRSTSDYGPQGSKAPNNSESTSENDGNHHHHRKSTATATVPMEGKTAGTTKKPYPDDLLTSGTVGAHNTEMANRVEQRIVPDEQLSSSKGSQGISSGTKDR